MNIPSTEVVAYTAGLLDGEGSIGINPSQSSSRRGYWYWGLTVQISSCAGEVLVGLQQEWDVGTITSWQPKNGKRRASNWRFYSRHAEHILTHTIPFLRIKREQARVALEFRKVCGFKRGEITDEIASRRKALAMEIRELNAKTAKAKPWNDISHVR